jgi:hypothetical protein
MPGGVAGVSPIMEAPYADPERTAPSGAHALTLAEVLVQNGGFLSPNCTGLFSILRLGCG